MTIRTIPRVAVGGSLRLLRLPLDGTLRFAGEGERASALKLAVDRADATVRGIAALLLADDTLSEDARRRREAADERERALRLRGKAEERSERADARITKGRREAEQTRARGSQAGASRREERAKRARVESLESRAEALEEQEDALAAEDESRRLRAAASRAKGRRKARR